MIERRGGDAHVTNPKGPFPRPACEPFAECGVCACRRWRDDRLSARLRSSRLWPVKPSFEPRHWFG